MTDKAHRQRSVAAVRFGSAPVRRACAFLTAVSLVIAAGCASDDDGSDLPEAASGDTAIAPSSDAGENADPTLLDSAGPDESEPELPEAEPSDTTEEADSATDPDPEEPTDTLADGDVAEDRDADAGDGLDRDGIEADTLGENEIAEECGQGTVAGQVCAPSTLSEVKFATVWVQTTDCLGNPIFRGAETDNEGKFKLFNVPEGTQKVFVDGLIWEGWFEVFVKDDKITYQTNAFGCGVPGAEPPGVCDPGTVVGNICPPGGNTISAGGIAVTIVGKNCTGDIVEVTSNSNITGEFVLTGVPQGPQVLQVAGETSIPGLESVWTKNVFVDPGVTNDTGHIGAIACGGVEALPSGGSAQNGLGAICTDPKWNLCGEELVDFCTDPEPPFPDCNGDGVPDACPQCPPVEVVFIFDTSGSMSDEISALCDSIADTISTLESANIYVETSIYGLGEGVCGKPSFEAEFGNTATSEDPDFAHVSIDEPCGSYSNENWGPASIIVATNKSWFSNSVRMVVPISDEGPTCGDPLNEEDSDYALALVEAALKHDVIISPISGTGSAIELTVIAEILASQTKGLWHETTDPEADLASYVLLSAFAACSLESDCNANAVPDDCDIANGTLADFNGNGIPDACE